MNRTIKGSPPEISGSFFIILSTRLILKETNILVKGQFRDLNMKPFIWGTFRNYVSVMNWNDNNRSSNSGFHNLHGKQIIRLGGV